MSAPIPPAAEVVAGVPDPTGSKTTGYWVPRLEFNRLDKLDALSANSEQTIKALREEVGALKEQIVALTKTSSDARADARLWQATYLAEHKELTTGGTIALHPTLWFGFGVVAGGLGFYGATVAAANIPRPIATAAPALRSKR